MRRTSRLKFYNSYKKECPSEWHTKIQYIFYHIHLIQTLSTFLHNTVDTVTQSVLSLKLFYLLPESTTINFNFTWSHNLTGDVKPGLIGSNKTQDPS